MTEKSSKNTVFSARDVADSVPRLHVPDIERNLPSLGREYIVGDLGVTGTTDVLQGQMSIVEVQEGMTLYRTAVQDLRSMRTSNLLYPGMKIVLLLEGQTDLRYGERRVQLRAGDAAHCGAMLMLTRTDRFMRQWHAGQRERKLVITVSEAWLAHTGLLAGRMAEFAKRHLELAPWVPSSKALALADQLHRGSSLPQHLHALWQQSRCLEIVLEAITAVESVWLADQSAPMVSNDESMASRPTCPQQWVRLAALRDWLTTPAADGMDVCAIASHAGMSVAHLQRHFPAVAKGQSLAQFVRVQRMDRARRALEQGSASVAQAAQLAGYRSSTHFSAAFRNAFGVLPSRLKPVL